MFLQYCPCPPRTQGVDKPGYESGPSAGVVKGPYEFGPKPNYEVPKPVYQELPPKQPSIYEKPQGGPYETAGVQKPPGYEAVAAPLKAGPPGAEYAGKNGGGEGGYT
jgi:hypothetical protein